MISWTMVEGPGYTTGGLHGGPPTPCDRLLTRSGPLFPTGEFGPPQAMNKSSGSGASEGPHSRAAGREVRRTAHGATPHAPPHGRALANGGGGLRAQRIVSSWERLESRWEIHAKHRPDGYMREQGYGIRMGAEEGRV